LDEEALWYLQSINPFSFMELKDGQELAHFFERRVSADQIGVSGSVALHEEFWAKGLYFLYSTRSLFTLRYLVRARVSLFVSDFGAS
jgi:hypothetical protein